MSDIIMMVKSSVRVTTNPRKEGEKLFIGWIDFSMPLPTRRKFVKVYESFFNKKDYPIDRDMVAYSQSHHTVVITMTLKEYPGEAVASFLKKLPTVFNVIETSL
jgi:hypothetical protein